VGKEKLRHDEEVPLVGREVGWGRGTTQEEDEGMKRMPRQARRRGEQ
jgi:hypothetical protein